MSQSVTQESASHAESLRFLFPSIFIAFKDIFFVFGYFTTIVRDVSSRTRSSSRLQDQQAVCDQNPVLRRYMPDHIRRRNPY